MRNHWLKTFENTSPIWCSLTQDFRDCVITQSDRDYDSAAHWRELTGVSNTDINTGTIQIEIKMESI